MGKRVKGNVFGIENEVEFADIKGSLDHDSKPLVTVFSPDCWERYEYMLDHMPTEDDIIIVFDSKPDYL